MDTVSTQSNELKTKDMAAYRKQYYQEHKDDYKKKEVCKICGHSYSLYNKSHHMKLKKHIRAVEKLQDVEIKNEIERFYKEKIKKEIDELKDKIKDLT